jgi:hypothetical protein
MALRFQKRIKIMPGVRVNLSKKGISASVGKPGATVNLNKDGLQGTAGVPGTGLSYRSRRPTSSRGQATSKGGLAFAAGAIALVLIAVVIWAV